MINVMVIPVPLPLQKDLKVSLNATRLLKPRLHSNKNLMCIGNVSLNVTCAVHTVRNKADSGHIWAKEFRFGSLLTAVRAQPRKTSILIGSMGLDTPQLSSYIKAINCCHVNILSVIPPFLLTLNFTAHTIDSG